jgi:hypothetical protein
MATSLQVGHNCFATLLNNSMDIYFFRFSYLIILNFQVLTSKYAFIIAF